MSSRSAAIARRLRVAGISVRGMLIAVYALGGLMAGFAALLMTARMNSAHPTAGIGMEFDAIAAVAVGGTSFERGNGWLLGTLLGVIAVGVLRNGLNLLAVPSSAQVACIGALVIVALFIDGLRSRAMSTATDTAVRSRLALSRDVMQAFYRLLAVALLCVDAGAR